MRFLGLTFLLCQALFRSGLEVVSRARTLPSASIDSISSDPGMNTAASEASTLLAARQNWRRAGGNRVLKADARNTREGFDRHHVAATVPREAEAAPKLLPEPEVRENFSGPGQAETEIVPVAGHCVPARGEAVQVPEFPVPLTWTGNHAEVDTATLYRQKRPPRRGFGRHCS